MHHFNCVTSMQQPGYFERRYDAFPGGHVTISSMVVKYTAYEHQQVTLAESRDLPFPGLEQNGWKLLDLFPGIAINLRGSALRVDTMTPLAADKVLIEFRGLGLRRDTPAQRALRVRDHNTIWGPFGRNLPEDLLGVVNQGLALLPRGTEPMQLLHGREEGRSIHDEHGVRKYYDEWSRRMQRDARDPFRDRPAPVRKLPQLNVEHA
jgi:methanesulfonate monooxygenase large subunit